MKSIEFEVKNPKDKDDISPYISLASPEEDLEHLADGDAIVCKEQEIVVIIDYPVENEAEFTIKADGDDGFTRREIAKKISESYQKMYLEEEKSTQISIVPIDQRVGLINRNKTDGKYGIWGHDIGDLVLHTVTISKCKDGRFKANLGVDS